MSPKYSFLILALLSIALLSSPAAANIDITFADLNLIDGVHILVYNATASGTLVGEYNSTDTVSLDSTQNYIFILKPTSQSMFTSPQATIDMLGAYLPITINYVIAGIFIIGIAYAVSRLWK